MRRLMLIASLAPAMALTACAGYENTTRDAVVGGALGAAAGAVIGNNTGSGDAATGAAQTRPTRRSRLHRPPFYWAAGAAQATRSPDRTAPEAR